MPSLSYSYPKLCGLLAKDPSKLSFAMHTAAFANLGLDFTYVVFDTLETEQALRAMRELGIRGYSLTIPHKEIALKFVDELSEEAKKIAAINTVINENGRLIAYNTDCFGISEAFSEKGISLKGKKAFIFGAGGAARAAIYCLQKEGAAKIFVANRTNARAKALAKEFSLEQIDYSKLSTFSFSETDIFINSSPIGSHLTDDKYPFEPDVFDKNHLIFEMVTRETELVKSATKKGAMCISGLRMLLFQAVKQFEYFTGERAPVSVMEEALLKAQPASV